MDYRIDEISRLIECSFPLQQSLKHLAEHANLSVSHLQHLFRAEKKMSVKQYFKKIQIKQACYLLETTNLRIKEICFEIGASDNSHFADEFKKSAGLSPTEYRISFRVSHRNRIRMGDFDLKSP